MNGRIGALLVKVWALLWVGVDALSSLLPRSLLSGRRSEFGHGATRRTVVVIGGGFGGLYAAIQMDLKADDQTDIFLIEPKDNFVFSPLLYELAVGTASSVEVAPSYQSLLATSRVKHLRSSVESFDVDTRSVVLTNELSEKKTMNFDVLVMAVGIQPRVDAIPGAREHAIPFYTVNSAMQLMSKLKALRSKKREDKPAEVVVVGGGYGGVEVAANVAEYLGRRASRVTILDRNSRILATSAEFNRRAAERALKTKGVQVRYNTAVRRVHEDGVDIHDPFSGASETIPADLVLLSAGTEQTGLIQHTALRKDAFGRIVTNRSLQSIDVPYVFALGDCSAVEGDANPSTAQVAMQQAPVVAQNVLAYLDQVQNRAAGDSAGAATEARVGDSSTMKQFRFFSLGEMLSLGDTNASIVSLGGWVTLSGPIAALGRRAAYGVRMPTLTQSLTALVSAGAVTSGKLLSSMFQK